MAKFGQIRVKFGQIWLDLGKIKILHPQKLSISYGYAKSGIVYSENCRFVLKVLGGITQSVILKAVKQSTKN